MRSILELTDLASGKKDVVSSEGMISTTYAKVASDDAKELLAWATKTGLTIAACSSCKPD